MAHKSFFKTCATWTSRLIANILITLIVGLRPLLGPACCKFGVSCTDFAVLKLKEGPLLHAIWEITKRLARCQPFYRPKN
jgi:putative component of membrane protein insertase Oxa1/YidC/SpoIIIJ protein YidD